VIDSLLDRIDQALPPFDPLPFETLAGQYEPRPYQFVGPLQEFPQAAPVRYLLLTHWTSPQDARRWLASDAMMALAQLGTVSSALMVLVRHQSGERAGLNADGSQREFGQLAVA
jgi:hypothetical protein